MICGRTEHIIGGSTAKNCEESDFEVRFRVAPPKPVQNTKKKISETGKSSFFCCGVEKSNIGDGLKRAYAKLQAEWSHV